MSTYTHGHEEAVLRSHRWRTAENSCAYLLPSLRGDESLLDVGCGPATITADLATRVRSVVGIDPSASVIEEARRTYPSIDLRVGDVFELDGAYDVVHAHQVLHHLSDPVGALRRMRALSTSLVAVRESDYGAFRWGPDAPALERWMEVFLAVMAHNGANPDAGRHLLHWAQEAGFEDVTYTTSTWTFTGEDASWWGSMWADRCTSSSFATQAVELGITTSAELATIAQGWRDWTADPGAAFVCLHGEILARP
jgi:SAM-dependent methyltransferase